MLDISAVRSLYHESGNVAAGCATASRGRRRHELTRNLVLPPVISEPDDVFAFHLLPTQPNFITQRSVTAPVSTIEDSPEQFVGTIC